MSIKLILKQARQILKTANDWEKLKDPAFRDLLKKKMESAPKSVDAPKSSNNPKSTEVRFKPKKKREDMTAEEEAKEEAKILARFIERAKSKRGLLELSMEEAKPLLRMFSAILNANVEDSLFVKKQRQVLKSIMHGEESKGSSRPGVLRTKPDGEQVFVITSGQLGLVVSIYETIQKELERKNNKTDKENKFKSMEGYQVRHVPKAQKPMSFEDLEKEDLELDEESTKLLTGSNEWSQVKKASFKIKLARRAIKIAFHKIGSSEYFMCNNPECKAGLGDRPMKLPANDEKNKNARCRCGKGALTNIVEF